jgi:hypothetical protein
MSRGQNQPQERQLSCIVENDRAAMFVSIHPNRLIYTLLHNIRKEYCSNEGFDLAAVTGVTLWKVCATLNSAFVWLNRGFGLTAQ